MPSRPKVEKHGNRKMNSDIGRTARDAGLAAVLLFILPALAIAGESAGPRPLPADAPKLKKDVVVLVAGSSVSVRRYKVYKLPAWTGGADRVPPQCTNGQNVFFRVFEILNDHENMCWRRLTDKDWVRKGEWKGYSDLPYKSASPRISWMATDPGATAELKIPAGYEKVDLIYTSDPQGDKMKVSIDGKAPAKNALIDTYQETRIPADANLGPDIETLDSHGKPRKLRRPKRGIKNIVELRARYEIDKSKPHTLSIQRATNDPKKRILVWGAVYWRGNCVQVVQRAKGGINCGDLPNYPAIQETVALKPDYILMEAINIRGNPTGVTRSLEPGYAWCARHKDSFKTLVYSTPMASSKAFCAWFSDPKNKPPYGGTTKTVTAPNPEACHQVAVDLCKRFGFPLVDVGATVDTWCAKHKSAKFVPHILNDWYHPNQWGAALFGQTLFEGIKKHWPELPNRPINMPKPPGAK